MSMANKLTVNLDKLSIYEIDIDNPPFSTDGLSEEEIKALDEVNEEFLQKNVYPILIQRSAPCGCRQQEVLERALRRSQLMGKQFNGQIALEQEDVDAYNYGVILEVSGGKYTKVNMITQECSKCGRLSIWNGGSVFLRLMAESFTRIIDSASVPDTDEELLKSLGLDPSEYKLENLPDDDKEEAETEEES